MTAPTSSAPRPVRAAASLIVVRDGADGMEVLLLRRAEKEADQNSGASVFPGGVLDSHDPSMHGACRGLDDLQASLRLGVPDHGLDYYVAAVRECFEEAGLLFASDARDRLVALDALAPADLAALRHAAQEGTDALLHLCARHGWRLAVDRLQYLTHWLTPPGMPRRFDTRFFVALAPAGQTASPDLRETVGHLWLRPAEALDARRALKLMNVTRRILEQLQVFPSAQACLGHARALREVAMIMPRIAAGKNGRQPVNPWEPAYAEIARLDPEGHGQARCEIEPGTAVRLSPHVIRVSSAGQRHGYLVGGGVRNEWALLDPVQGDEAHLAALQAAAPGPVRWTLCTAAAAQPTADRRLSPGESLELGACTLRAVRAPGGEAADLCFLLLEEKTLFSGACPAPALATLPEDFDWVAAAQGFLQARPVPTISIDPT